MGRPFVTHRLTPVRMECCSDKRNRPCPGAQKKKAVSKKFDEKCPLVTKAMMEKEDKRVHKARRKTDAESYSSGVGTTSLNFPVSSSSSSSSSTYNLYEEVSSWFYAEGSGNVGGGMTAFFDEEEVFNMHGLLDGMAEGLMMSPMGCGLDWGGVDYVDLTLWSCDD